MDTRLVALIMAGGISLGCAAEQSAPKPAEIRAEDLRPYYSAQEPRMLIVWHFKTEDCLGCTLPDHEIRRIQSQFGDRVPLLAVHIGDAADSVFVKPFFASRRLRYTLVTVDPDVHASADSVWSVPSVALLSGGKVVWKYPPARDSAASPPLTIDSAAVLALAAERK